MSDQPTTTEGGLAAPTVLAILGDDSSRVQAAVRGLIRKYRNRRHEVTLLSADELYAAMAKLMFEYADIDPAFGVVGWLNWIGQDADWFIRCARDNGLTIVDGGPAVVRDGQLVPLAIDRATIPVLRRAGALLEETRSEVRLVVKRLIVEFAAQFDGVIICVDATAIAILTELLGDLGRADKLVKVQLTATNEPSNDPDVYRLDVSSLDDLETVLALDRHVVSRQPHLAPRLMVLSGPSGVGKATVYRGVQALIPELHQPISDTTRARRPGEPADAYNFITHEEFARRIKAGYYLEYNQYGKNFYGTPRNAVGDGFCMLEIEVNGAAAVKAAMPDARTILLVPPGDTVEEQLGHLERRIRGDVANPRDDLMSRLATAQLELLAPADHVVVNRDIEGTVREFAAII